MENLDRPSLLVIIRHALSLRNAAKKKAVYFADEAARACIKGIPDHKIPITPEGWPQAEKTGVGLRKDYGVPDYVYDSGYLRTEETREGALRAYTAGELNQIKIRHSLFLRERDPGYCYDMTEQEAEAAFPWQKQYWKTFGGFLACPPAGQSLAQQTAQVHLFLNMLFHDRAGKKVFVFTHGGTIRCFRFLLEHWDYDRALRWPPGESPKNCGVTVYEYDKNLGSLVLKEYNKIYY